MRTNLTCLTKDPSLGAFSIEWPKEKPHANQQRWDGFSQEENCAIPQSKPKRAIQIKVLELLRISAIHQLRCNDGMNWRGKRQQCNGDAPLPRKRLGQVGLNLFVEFVFNWQWCR